MPHALTGLAALAPTTDLFIVDLWGVVHGGVAPFPGVVETLDAMRSAGKHVVFVSNAPVRAHHVARQLERLDLGTRYDALLTSGEMTWRHLSEHFAAHRYHGIGPSWAKLLHEDLPHAQADRLEDADLLLVVGVEDERPEPSAYEPELQAARTLDLPLICANPDRVIVVQDGTYSWCAGAIAERYEEIGGEVVWLGKPNARIFEEAAAAVGIDDPARVVVVGDGLPTDIAGANDYGCRSVLITRGIHARDMGVPPGEIAAPELVAQLLDGQSARPDHVMATLRW